MNRFTGRLTRRLGPGLVSLAAVAIVTGAIELLRPHVPVLGLVVLYIIAVLPVGAAWGTGYAIAVALASMLAFNFFFIPPLHTLTIAESRNWFALLVFVITAIVVGELSARSRRQAREAALLKDVATSLLERGEVTADLERIAAEAARALQADRTFVELSGGRRAPEGLGEWYPLAAGGRRVGRIYIEGPRRRGAAARRRLLPALASLLGVAIDRERLAREALDAEALRQSDAMKTALLRAVSHDLRTPLMAILTAASALDRSDLDLDPADRRELAATILGGAQRLDHLVGNLLDLARLQAGALRPEPDLWTIDDLVVQALEELGGDGARIEVSLLDESPAVRVDAQQVQRVLVNLIENALRYSSESEPVHVQVTSTAAEMLVRVVDRGPGIPEGELETVFEPFQRGSRSSTVAGAGLGLAIARGFAEANGGRVWAESRAGQGATFALALPLARLPIEVTA